MVRLPFWTGAKFHKGGIVFIGIADAPHYIPLIFRIRVDATAQLPVMYWAVCFRSRLNAGRCPRYTLSQAQLIYAFKLFFQFLYADNHSFSTSSIR